MQIIIPAALHSSHINYDVIFIFPLLFLTPLCTPLLCRYEVVASAKLLGGFSFAYTVRGDRATKAQQLTPIPGSMQRKALHMVHFMYPL